MDPENLQKRSITGTMSNGVHIIILVFLALLSSLFSATETAYSSVSPIKLKNLARDGNRRAARVLEIINDFDRFLTTILIGNNIVNIIMTTVSTLLFTRIVGGAYGPTVSTIVITVVVLIFGEITPKTIARKIPVRFSCATVGFVQFFEGLLLPLSSIMGGLQNLVNKHIRVKDGDANISDELMMMVSEAQRQGNLMERESSLISNAIDFRDLCVENVLTPRVKLVGVDLTMSVEAIGRLFRMNSFSRLPVYENSIDNIVGIIHQKDFYVQVYHDNVPLRKIIQPVVYVTRGTRISSLLNQLQASKLHMAVVLDEFGGTDGIVTLEDILEELVGEIWDEHDIVKEYYEEQDDGTYLIQCDAEIDDLFKRFGIKYNEAEDQGFITVSGWIIHHFGYIPRVGETFDFQNLHITITQVDMRKVLQVKVEQKALTIAEGYPTEEKEPGGPLHEEDGPDNGKESGIRRLHHRRTPFGEHGRDEKEDSGPDTE